MAESNSSLRLEWSSPLPCGKIENVISCALCENDSFTVVVLRYRACVRIYIYIFGDGEWAVL